MNEKIKNYLNVCNVVTLLMFITLFSNWFKDWSTSASIPKETAFTVAKEYKIMWIIIICTIISLLVAIVISNVKSKTSILGILALVNILICIVGRFTMVGSGKFMGVSRGWVIMLILCVIQIGYAISNNKKEVSNIIEKEISKI